MLRKTVEYPETDAPDIIAVPLSEIVNVAGVDAVLVTSISLTTVVVDDGDVYRVVLDVEAAPRNNTVAVVAI